MKEPFSGNEHSATASRKEVYEGHPEVHHYTNLEGVAGIWISQKIRATRFDCLNDSSEIGLFRQYLRSALPKEFSRHIEQQSSTNAKMRAWVKSNGGIAKLAEEGTKWLAEALYRTTYGADLVPSANSFAIPFISSFCTHCDIDQEYEREHGLLSQWRAYGRSTPCAIVFDTKRLTDLLRKERALFGSFRQVIYSNDQLNADKMFSPLIRKIVHAWTAPDEMQVKENLEDCFTPFVNDSACFKHHAFSEENEVRIISVPQRSHGLPADDPDNFSLHPLIKESQKPIFDSQSQRVRYRMHLFGGVDEMLPIRRIIVGPSSRQNAVYEELRRLIDGRVPISTSQTPYLD
ncbi:MAG: DUF2971 domain-containing protein [Proteobacteria bacterium]|nr:DUF2971 domain-containing protein [Pseudomonadota bacterium]